MRRSFLSLVLVGLLSTACGASSKAMSAPAMGGPAGYPAMSMSRAAGGEAAPEVAMADMDGAAMEEAPSAPPAAPAPVLAKELDAQGAEPASPTSPASAPPPSAPNAGAAAGQGQVASADARRAPILVYRADFTMSVFEVPRALDRVERLAADAGGYLARRDDRSITIRVPVAAFSSILTALEKEGDVLSRNVRTDDVTAEFRDLEVQLQNLRAMRARFEKLLEMATKVEDALQIERELGRITGEIERIRGRLKLLADLAQFSTITVRFEPRATQTTQEGPFVLPLPWLQDLGLRRLMSL
jgi:hypothetical protein